MAVQIINADCREALKGLADASVQACVTSPPYFGLRDYGHDGQIGLEISPAAFVAVMVEVFREVRRVLRDDGTLWLNLGDSYASQGGAKSTPHLGKHFVDRARGKEVISRSKRLPRGEGRWGCGGAAGGEGLKPTDRMGIPWRVAFALQDDGWYLRQDIIWSKPNPMPESVTDRCTKAHEYLFLLSKSERYFWDAAAIAEPAQDVFRPTFRGGAYINNSTYNNSDGGKSTDVGNVTRENATRNKRSVWEIATQPFPEAHFATFPPALIEPCIKAGTSEKGCCAKCGAPWVREVERTQIALRPNSDSIRGNSPSHVRSLDGNPQRGAVACDVKTLGWSPSCSCDQAFYACEPCNITKHINELTDGCPKCGQTMVPSSQGNVPCTVLDPFGGAGTTGLVADRLGRNAIMIELNPEYAAMAEQRIRNDAGMFAQVAAE